MQETMITLNKLKKGQNGIIQNIQAHGDIGKRIRDMGFTVGSHVEIIGKAPFNDPIAVRLKGGTLSLRTKEAECIMVQLLS